jgi:hypothetical protein
MWTLERTVELAFRAANEEVFEFRLEVLSQTSSSKKKFKCKLFRYEAFKVEPAFEVDPEFRSVVHTWAIWDSNLPTLEEQARGPDDALDWYVAHLSRRLGVPEIDDFQES